MGHRSNVAAMIDASTKPRKEDFARGMGRRSKVTIVAYMMDAPNKLRKEECVLDMGHRSNDAAMMDARIMLLEEKYALGMGHRSKIPNVAAMMDAPTMPRKVEFV